jgi:hypothetical protein
MRDVIDAVSLATPKSVKVVMSQEIIPIENVSGSLYVELVDEFPAWLMDVTPVASVVEAIDAIEKGKGQNLTLLPTVDVYGEIELEEEDSISQPEFRGFSPSEAAAALVSANVLTGEQAKFLATETPCKRGVLRVSKRKMDPYKPVNYFSTAFGSVPPTSSILSKAQSEYFEANLEEINDALSNLLAKGTKTNPVVSYKTSGVFVKKAIVQGMSHRQNYGVGYHVSSLTHRWIVGSVVGGIAL